MCAHPPRRFDLRHFFTNWKQPLPLHVKLALTARNLSIRLLTPALCCGHDGEPGC